MFVTMQNIEKTLLQTKVLLSKSDDELSIENCDTNNENSLLQTKHISSSTGSLNRSTLRNYKDKRKAMLMQIVNIKEEQMDDKYHDWSLCKSDKGSYIDDSLVSISDGNISLQEHINSKKLDRGDDTATDTASLSRQLGEPLDMNSSQNTLHETSETELVKQKSEASFSVSKTTDSGVISLSKYSVDDKRAFEYLKTESRNDNQCVHLSPAVKNRLWNVYVAHTSTPSNLLRKSLVTNDHMLTPITKHDKSMSPITQSATKMTKAMQVCIIRCCSS